VKLILDGDYGIDDSLAALFLAHGSDVEILAVGSVHGNATAEAAARNALAVLDIGGRPDVPVAVGARRPLVQPGKVSPLVHGDDGLGGEAPPLRPGRTPVAAPAAVLLIDTVRAHPGECTVLATGPLTNLALALLLDPEVAGLVAGVVLMGGTVDHPGNVNPYAEFNITHDPEATRMVIGAPWPVTQVGLDVTMSTWLDEKDLDRIESSETEAGRFAWRILRHYLDFYRSRHGRTGCPLHDPSAALVAVEPDLATWTEAAVDVEIRSDQKRGMLLLDRDAGEALVRIVTALDRDRLVATFLEGLLTQPG